MNYIFSKHALKQFAIRGVSRDLVEKILFNPDKVIVENNCTHIYQYLLVEEQKKYLYRIFVNVCKKPMLVITGYKTSKIEKYEN